MLYPIIHYISLLLMIIISIDAQMWYDNFNILKLGEDVFKLAVPFSNPLSEKSFLKLSELSGQTIVTPSRESPSVFQICRMLEKEYPDTRLLHQDFY